MGDAVRLFVGVKIAMASVRALADMAEAMRREAAEANIRVRWVDPAQYHVTLKFIDWTRAEAVEAMRDAIGGAVTGTAFEISHRGVGAFPKPERARVLWSGIEDPKNQLSRLAHDIERAVQNLGVAPESRAYHPHVTLGRLKDGGNVSSLLVPRADLACGQTWVDSVTLFESVTKPSGAEYLVRADWPLGDGRRS